MRVADRVRAYRGALVGLMLLFGSLWAFGVLVEDVVTGDPIVRLDARLANWLHEQARPSLTEFFEVVTVLGNAVVVIGLALVSVIVLARRGRRRDALLVAVAVTGAEALTLAMKLGFRRERPFFPDPLSTESTFSFPSGHAMVSVAVYGVLAFVLVRELASWRVRVVVLVSAAALVLLIGFSRLYLGVHYLSDVLAGFTGGLAWLVLCVLAFAGKEAWPFPQTSRYRAWTKQNRP